MAVYQGTNTSGRWRRDSRERCQARSTSGSALVELAVVSPLLLFMALGVGDLGRVVYTSLILSHAARAGAQYGAQTNATTGDASGIRAAALDEAQDISPVAVTSQRICECPGAGTVSCSTTMCTGYGVPQVFVQVTTTKTFQTLTPYPGIPSAVPLSRTAIVRRQ